MPLPHLRRPGRRLLSVGIGVSVGAAALLGLATLPASASPQSTPHAMLTDSAVLGAEQARLAQAPRQPGEAKPGEHIARQPLPATRLPLRNAESLLPRQQRYGEATEPSNEQSERSALSPQARSARALQSRLASQAAAANCSGSDFVGKAGSTLIAFIDQASLRGCMYQLYSGSVDQYRSVFSDANIISVANALKQRALNYPGNDTGKAMNLLSFLRTAGYWSFMSQAGDASNGIAPGSRSMLNAAGAALRQLTQAPHFYDISEDNAYFVSEVFKTVPAGFAPLFAPAAKRWIDQAQPSSFATGYWTNDAILQAMNVLFYGDYQVDFQNAVKNDPSLPRSLDSFLTRNRSLLGGDYAYHLSNAMGEMLRFLRYPALKAELRNLGINQLRYFPVTQDNAVDVWLRAATMVDQYDAGNCSAYGTCNAYDRIAAIKLPIRYACGSQYTIRAQAMTAQQLSDTCASISQQTGYFHTLMGTQPGQPVGNDGNAQLELVVFDSYAQYSRFSGYLFGNDTNNGGIYLEGDPAAPGNVARFLAHRADWLAGFEIWNLNHEFTHYLDGRYNLWGAFWNYPLELNAAVRNPAVWWIEGVAEYVSYSYRRQYYADATSRAQTAPLALSEVLRNTYSSGQTRVYNWGYLAVRYMLERQPNQDRNFLPLMRTGNYAGYSAQIDAIGSSLDSDFSRWLGSCIASGDTSSAGCVSQRPGTLPLLNASAIGACNLGNASALANGCSKALSAGSGSYNFYISASGWNDVLFRLSQVQGGVDLYAKAGGWASASDHDVKAGGAGGSDLIVKLPSKGQGWVYVNVVPRAGFQGAQLRAMFSQLPLGSSASFSAAAAH
ncbi:collagenase [Paucibacter sp. APW11]|uniref:microbial collagenase n=1 Tax=Roseateles aquae TaxID=3077235 RepID=A0ABU3P7M7_9BURK|nr:collagenase [Paucibacter sp. APW11]MDT8998317.1 collagenase [Paucibacter sp. APW11]